MKDVSLDLIEQQSMRIHLALGGDPDDGWPLIEERVAVKLLDQLSDANRKALLHVAAVDRNFEGFVDIDFVVAVARLHGAEADTVAFGWGWTPAQGKPITPQQTIALRLSQYLLASIEWDAEIDVSKGDYHKFS